MHPIILGEPDTPLIFDYEGRNVLYPTLFLLWKYPDTLPVISIPSPVSTFLLRGADLMAPGVLNLQGKMILNLNPFATIQVLHRAPASSSWKSM